MPPALKVVKTERLRARMRVAVHASLIEAAERSIVEDGVEGASLQSIARRAGVAVGTIYNYFSDRQELFREVFTSRRAELVTSMDAAMKTVAHKPFRAQLEAFALALLGNYESRIDFIRVVFASEPLRLQMMCDKSGRFRPLMDELQARAERVMRIGVREKRLKEEDVALYASIFTSILKGVLMRGIDGDVKLSSIAPRAVEIFCHGAIR